MQRIHFISGLPRSGSTLLTALLNQNPRLSADIASPVINMWGAIIPQMNGKGELRSFFDDNLRRDILTAIHASYHKSTDPIEVVFDNNRGWTGYINLINSLYPDSRIVCCMRNVSAIIGSFECALNKNPLRTSGVFGFTHGTSLYWRVKTLMDPDSGVIGRAYDALRGAWYGDKSHMLIAVDYDYLVSEPQAVLDRLYDALREPRFEHDLNNIQFNRPRYDEDLGMPGLHNVRERVEIKNREPLLPPDIFDKYEKFSFWKNADQRSSKAARLF